MIRTLLFFWALFIPISMTFAQSNNRLEIFYTPQISKTNFEEILENNPGPFMEFYETSEPNRPLIGYSFGISYARKIKTMSLGFYLRQNLRGQRSSVAYNYRGLYPQDTLPGYGGLFYHLQMKSITSGLSFGATLYATKVFSTGVYLDVGLDVYQIAFLEEFTINPENGLLEGGCCRQEYKNYPNNYFVNIGRHVKYGYYRLEFAPSWRNEVQIYKNLYLNLELKIFLLTKILKYSPELDSYVPDGSIFSIGSQFGLSYYF